ncbi:ethanolamine ammonia-lyase reactivating factor EutA [Cohnella sp.]|uniref:ethanolamine ammonia-lyase reactivating factor EutA n=1 Tax=Cohnella sp. TaxID=1883426 RepID=UPI00356ADE9A
MTAADEACDEWITSVGIDLGTSTTKMIVSRLRISRISNAFSMPAFTISERALAYCSEIYTTPLKSGDELDYEQISGILRREYDKAGIRLEDIKTGAVIITGETANKKNAQHILHELAERAGDFVVATAGAHLEGVLAGKGSGAEARSLHTRKTVVNVDIGGGTANAAFFREGACICTATLRIGGRLIRIDAQGNVLDVAPSFAPWLKARGYKIAAGGRVSFADIREVSERMAESLMSFLAGEGGDEFVHLLVVGEMPGPLPEAAELMISGGIADLLQSSEPQLLEQAALHEDIGPLLAHAVKRAAGKYPFAWVPARQTVRATVIGAGMQSTEISGATVYISPGVLPIRNLPVVKLQLSESLLEDETALGESVTGAMETGKKLHSEEISLPFALSLSGIGYCSYSRLQRLADAICGGYIRYFKQSGTIAVICHNDMAQALGQAMAIRMGGSIRIVCVDQIAVEHGDYIDMGEPIAGSLVPVIIKTLAFSAPVDQAIGFADKEGLP